MRPQATGGCPAWLPPARQPLFRALPQRCNVSLALWSAPPPTCLPPVIPLPSMSMYFRISHPPSISVPIGAALSCRTGPCMHAEPAQALHPHMLNGAHATRLRLCCRSPGICASCVACMPWPAAVHELHPSISLNERRAAASLPILHRAGAPARLLCLLHLPLPSPCCD